ncbi:MAG: DUF4091 domain-containing protein [Thermoguttaceae bacterium]|nr:DUF4091 domain-containing protein [Thermoguttaceae bacterium]
MRGVNVRSAVLILFFLGVLGITSSSIHAQDVSVWVVDPHVKVFRDTTPPAGGDLPGQIHLKAARNEFEPAQVAVRSRQELKGLRVEWGALQHESGATIPSECLTWNFVGFIPMPKNTPGSEGIRICQAPCDVPDPLLADRVMDLPPERTQPIWLTVRVPAEAAAGKYQGEIRLVADNWQASVPVVLEVFDFVLPSDRHLWMTNWFNLNNIARAHNVDMWSEAFWEILARYARNMAEHRQNVVLVPWTLVDIYREADGTLSFDFARFDRYVRLFMDAGVAGQLEISHVGRGEKGWGTTFVLNGVTAVDRQSNKRIRLSPEEGLRPLLKALEEHLDKQGWLKRSMIHVADEPILTNLDSWKKASAFVREAAPRIRRIEAIETIGLEGYLEVWVPQLSHFERWRQAYEARRNQGEFWYYICVNPHGSVYPNRFLDYPLSAVRVLHWINFSEKLRGYLHWGWNFWGENPFGPPTDRLPPGDTHIVYPGPDGPLNSLRWEIQRESVEDFEYLHLLAVELTRLKEQQGEKAAWFDPCRYPMELARKVVPSIVTFERDPKRIMRVREELAEAIVAARQSPLLLVQTEPSADTVLWDGPVVVELFGLTEPGAEVVVNGRKVALREDGTFQVRLSPSRPAGEVVVQVRKDGQSKTLRKQFVIKP